MPTYDYECDACGHKFEKFHSMTAPSLKKCHKCAKLALRRLIGTGAGVIFKGSGFYQTDYRSDSYRQAAKKDSAASTTTSSAATPSGGSAAGSAPTVGNSSGSGAPTADSSAGDKGQSKADTGKAPTKAGPSAKAKKGGK